jgi:hypothetical protein
VETVEGGERKEGAPLCTFGVCTTSGMRGEGGRTVPAAKG